MEWTIQIEQGHSVRYSIQAEDVEEAIAEARRRWDRGDYYKGEYSPLSTHVRVNP